MGWQEFWIQIGGVSATMAALAYVASKAIDSYITAKGDAFRQTLERDVEEHKAKLERMNTEHSVRFAALHAERAQVVKTLYTHVCDLVGAVDAQATFLQVGIGGTSHSESIRMALMELIKYYPPNRIFLSESVCVQVEQLVGTISLGRGHLYSIQLLEDASKKGAEPSASQLVDLIDQFIQSRDQMRGLRAELERDFRALLGHA